MTAVDFFLADQNSPFLIAAAVMLGIGALEMLSLVMGLGLSDLLDSLLPDLDVDVDLDVDAGVDLDGPEFDVDGPDVGAGGSNFLAQAFGWLNVGRVPLLILLVTFLAGFAVVGFAVQLFARASLGLLPALIVAPAALAAALPITRVTSRLVGAIMPREETYAVSEAEFVGLVGTVTLGPVDRDTPGKAKLTDKHGNLHFVRVRSEARDRSFQVNEDVLLVRREGALFEVIAAPDSLSTDH
jgi:hypothetical protein